MAKCKLLLVCLRNIKFHKLQEPIFPAASTATITIIIIIAIVIITINIVT